MGCPVTITSPNTHCNLMHFSSFLSRNWSKKFRPTPQTKTRIRSLSRNKFQSRQWRNNSKKDTKGPNQGSGVKKKTKCWWAWLRQRTIGKKSPSTSREKIWIFVVEGMKDWSNKMKNGQRRAKNLLKGYFKRKSCHGFKFRSFCQVHFL